MAICKKLLHYRPSKIRTVVHNFELTKKNCFLSADKKYFFLVIQNYALRLSYHERPLVKTLKKEGNSP